MVEMNKKLIGVAVGSFAIGIIVMSLFFLSYGSVLLRQGGEIPLSFTVKSIHATVTFYRDGVKVFEFGHPGAVTKLGMNVTLAKLLGNNTFYNMTQYMLNTTYVSIGNQGTLNADSVVLPGEWNRTLGQPHDMTYTSFNITTVIHPAAGPYTADCLGLNFESGIGNNALWGYDTFTEVTGIDSTFTITVEIKVSVS